MIFNITGGGTGSVESELNFDVVTYATEEELLAATPSVNTIGVVTDIPITNWLFGYTEPNPAEEGMVWILTSELSSAQFNALKKNAIQVYPVYTQQYISGGWKELTSKIYQNGWNNLTAKGVPSFTYDGNYEIVNDSDEVIAETNHDNWKIRFLTSGTLKFSKLVGAINGIDVFCVGGGGGGSSFVTGNVTGGGGGGGYTKTSKNKMVEADVEYTITIGAGAGVGGTGGKTSAFGIEASGGGGSPGSGGAEGHYGGSGGSGGGGRNDTDTAGGGQGGYNGGNGSSGDRAGGGAGQGTTTKEFGESSGKMYAGGGAGAGSSYATNTYAPTAGGGGDSRGNAVANTGGGGRARGAGGSGIVVIRNARG